jgi:DNA repair exonuclease SbcCD ATPase subunit
VESLKVKLIELEAQRKKAIAAGDTDLSKNLTKQINQTKADIKGLNPTALKTTHKKTEKVYAEGSIAWQEQEVQRLTKAWKEAGGAVRDDYAVQLSYAKQQLAEMTGGFDPNNVRPIADLTGRTPMANLTQGSEITVPAKLEIKSPVEQWQAEIKRLQELIGQTWDSEAIDVYNQKIDQLNEKINEFSHTSEKGGESSSKAWSSTASAISSVGSAINAIDDPTAKIIGLVAQGIASVVSATGIATEKAAGQSRHWAEYLAAAASITAQMKLTGRMSVPLMRATLGFKASSSGLGGIR